MTRRRILWVVLTVLACILFVGGATALIVSAQSSSSADQTAKTIRESQVTNRKLAVDNAKVLDRINDCTTPGRKCFDDGQKRSAGIVAVLNQGSAAAAAAAAACATRPDVNGYRAIKACVDATLADQRP